MQTIKEAKFLRTNKEYTLEKNETGFNCKEVDFDDKPPIFRTFAQLLELSQGGQIVFAGFEEKKNEAELILLNCVHEKENSDLQLKITELETFNAELKKLLIEHQTKIVELEANLQILLETKEN